MSEHKPRIKPPKAEAVPLPRIACGGLRFWFGTSGFMLLLLLVFIGLAAMDGDPFPWLVVILWLGLFVGVPAWIGRNDWRRYRLSLELERDYAITTGTVIGFYDEDTAVGDQAMTVVYWIIFTLDDGVPVKQVVSLSTYQRVQVGDTVQVKVLLRDRRICRALFAD